MITLGLCILWYLDTKLRKEITWVAWLLVMSIDGMIFTGVSEIMNPSCESIRGAIELKGECECN